MWKWGNADLCSGCNWSLNPHPRLLWSLQALQGCLILTLGDQAFVFHIWWPLAMSIFLKRGRSLPKGVPHRRAQLPVSIQVGAVSELNWQGKGVCSNQGIMAESSAAPSLPEWDAHEGKDFSLVAFNAVATYALTSSWHETCSVFVEWVNK